MSSSSSVPVANSASLLQPPEPGLRLARGELARQPRPDQRVVLDVARGELRIGGVPQVGGDLMAPEEGLELLLALGTVEQQEARLGVTDAVAEGGIEAEGDLVDEIVHVALEAAVVVAREDHPPVIVENDPMREVTRLDAGEARAREDVTRAEVDQAQYHFDGHAPQQARFDVADRSERVMGGQIFEGREVPNMVRIGQYVARPVAKLVEPQQGDPHD